MHVDRAWFDAIAGVGRPPMFGLPDESVQARTVGRHGHDALNDAFMFWQFVRRMAESRKRPINQKSVILDFGVSWGRIIRFFHRDTQAGNLYGVDVEDRFLQHAKRDVPDVGYSLIHPAPPLPFEDNKFDVVYAYSVFSHLPQNLADLWIAEFARVLRPGGIACLTTRPRGHLRTKAEVYAAVFGDSADAEARYDRGEFVFFPMSGGGGLVESNYGEAIIPLEYARREWSNHFSNISFLEKYSETWLQPCFVLQKSDIKGSKRMQSNVVAAHWEQRPGMRGRPALAGGRAKA